MFGHVAEPHDPRLLRDLSLNWVPEFIEVLEKSEDLTDPRSASLLLLGDAFNSHLEVSQIPDAEGVRD